MWSHAPNLVSPAKINYSSQTINKADFSITTQIMQVGYGWFDGAEKCFPFGTWVPLKEGSVKYF